MSYAEKKKWVADLGNGEYQNPILFADYSDPDVIRVGDGFFMVASSFTYFPGLPVLYSKDLVNWRVISYAVPKLPFACYDVPQHGKGIWAPSIRFHDDFFWVCFGTPDEGIFMTKTKDPFVGWEDVVCLREAKGWIDPCPFWDDDGSGYIVHAFARSRSGIKSVLHINKLSQDGTTMVDEGQLLFDGRIHHPTIEGPKLYKRNGWYYIFAPAGGVTKGWQTVLRSHNIYGPYEHKVVMHQGDSETNGPHQGGLVELSNGDCFFIHFQDAGGYGRITHLQPVTWEEDWPIIGQFNKAYKMGEPVSTYKKPIAGVEVVTPATSDDFSSGRLGLQWQWQAHENQNNFSLKTHGEGLRIFSSNIASGANLLCDYPAMLTQLMQSPNFSAVTEVVPHLTADGDCAGLCITGGNYYAVRLQNVDQKLFLIQSYFEYNGQETPMEETIVDILPFWPTEKLFFKVELTYDCNMQFYYSEEGDYYAPIGTQKKFMVDRRSWVGGRVGLFCANVKQQSCGGFADFIRIDIEA